MPGEQPTDGILEELMAWAAAARVEASATERTRTRSLIDLQSAEGTWSGLMVDLAEDRAAVVARTASSRWTGHLVGAGPDFVVIERSPAGPLLVRLDALVSIARAGGSRGAVAPPGRRRPSLALDFAAAIEGLIGEGSPVAVWVGGETIRGRLTGAGQDVVSLLPEGSGAVTYLRLAAVDAVELR